MVLSCLAEGNFLPTPDSLTFHARQSGFLREIVSAIIENRRDQDNIKDSIIRDNGENSYKSQILKQIFGYRLALDYKHDDGLV